MLKKIAVAFLLFFSVLSFSQKNKNTIGFIENKGQIIDQNYKENKSVLYLLNTNGLNVQLRKNGFSYDVYEIITKPSSIKKKQKDELNLNRFEKQVETKQKIKFHRIDIDFLNSNSHVKLVSEEKSVDYDNYYNVAHAPNGITNVHKYQKVTYQNIYNKIDVVFFIPEDSTKVVEYNFVVKPGGKISDIQMQFKGARTELKNNSIKMATRFGDMEETLPMSWIEEENNKKQVSILYKKIKNNVYGLESSENLTGKKVIIDPVPIRLWGTYYGGEKDEYLLSLETDTQGNSYICGTTSSKDFIASSGAHQGIFGSLIYYSSQYVIDGFISKFDTNGNKIWSTFYGGDLGDKVKDIAISSNNDIGFCGDTWSNSNISTAGTFKPNKSGSYEEMFFGLLNSNGIRIWATYFGDNSGRSFMNSIAFDANNNIVIGGTTSAVNFIATSNSFKSTPPTSVYDFDGFISKFSINGNQIWGTYYGGSSGGDYIEDLIIDINSNIIAAGYTTSNTGISSLNAYQTLLNNSTSNINKYDGFIVNFNEIGNRNWGTYFGSNDDDKLFRLKNYNNYLYIIGETDNNNFATPGTFESTYTAFFGKVSFIAKFDKLTQQKVWSSYSTPKICDLDINSNEEIYLVGESSYLTSGIATPNAFLSTNGGFVSYIRKINNSCNILWGTYLGLTGFVISPFIKTNSNDTSFIVSGTCSTHPSYNYGLSTLNSQQESSNGNYETYINKFKDCLFSTTVSSTPTCVGSTLNLTASGGTNYTWTGPNGFTSNIQNPSISNVNATHSGQYTCTITGTGDCDGSKTITVQIQSTPAPTGNANQSFCTSQNATVSDIITNGTNVIWYNSASNTTPLTNTTLLSNNTTYFATQTVNGCESVNRLAVTINLINTLNATNYSEIICDDLNDNVEVRNLTNYNANLISSAGNIFSYYNSYNNAFTQNSTGQIPDFSNYNLTLGTNTFYVRIDSPNTCFQVVTLTLELVSKPIIPINDIEPLCEGKNITLNGGNNYDSYTWSTGETSQIITITQPGSYSVIVTENHGSITCTSTKSFVVINSNIATIQEIISSDWTENNNTITVLLHNNSQGDYEYSLNGIDFQDNNVFTNLEAGEYTVFVRDRNGCGMVSGELYLLMYPKFFTPNGDGYNEYWKIKFSENEPNLTVKIFDRYGKLLKHLGTNSLGWDGKYLGEDVPSSDYWFVVTRENGKEYKGHFSLKR